MFEMRGVPDCLIFAFLGCCGVVTVPAQQVKVIQFNVEAHIGNVNGNSTTVTKAIARIVNHNQPEISRSTNYRTTAQSTAPLL